MGKPSSVYINTLISAILGVVGIVVIEIIQANLEIIGNNPSRLFSIIIGLFIFIVAELYQMEMMSRKREKESRERFEHLDRWSRALVALEECSLDEKVIVDLCVEAGNITFDDGNDIWKSMAKKEAEDQISNLTSFLKNMSAGRINRQTEGTLELKELTRLAKSQVRATSMVQIDEDFWKSPVGDDYMTLMETLLRERKSSGFSIRRVFIVKDKPSKELCGIIKRQKKAGVQVKVLKYSDLDAHEKEDVVIFDNDVSFQVGITPDGTTAPDCAISGEGPDVKKFSDMFERIWDKADSPNVEKVECEDE